MERLTPRLTLVVLVLAGAMPVHVAAAHGPCGCLDPRLVEPGAKVTIRSPVYRALLNPRPAQFGIAPSYLASAYRPDSPTVTLISRSKRAPKPNLRFRVPRVPAGLYMVLIFDGSEGGAHNTWEYLHVLGPAPKGSTPQPARAASTRSDKDAGHTWIAWLTAGIALGVIATSAYSRWTPNRRR